MKHFITFCFFSSAISWVNAQQIHITWHTDRMANSANIGYEFGTDRTWSFEPLLRIQQNRQVKYYDHHDYLRRLHAFNSRQFIGLGLRVNRNFRFNGFTPQMKFSLSGSYNRLGSKAVIFEQVGTFTDSLVTWPIVQAKTVTFKPMNIFESNLCINFDIPLSSKLGLFYGFGASAWYYWGIDSEMFNPSVRHKLRLAPVGNLGFSIRL